MNNLQNINFIVHRAVAPDEKIHELYYILYTFPLKSARISVCRTLACRGLPVDSL